MLLTIFINYSILLSIFGYTFLLNKILFSKIDNIKIENIDFLYGFLFLIFLSIFLNLFFPLKFFTIPVILLGIIFFLIAYKKKNYKVNFLFYFLIIFFVTFIAFYGNDNVDSPMYHLQIIKWLTLHKISFGLVNLEIRFGFNSSWHSFVSLLNLTFGTFSAKYYISAIIFSFVVYETIRFKTKINLSDIFLYLFLCYLFLFSFLHPFYYGIILNHLGNPERDIVTMFLYFFSFYLFIKIFEEKNYTQYKLNLINLLTICTFICVTTRLTTLLILLLPLFVFFKNYQYKILNNLNTFFIIIVGMFWIMRSFILSGCFLFPIEQTCFDTSWSVNIETLQFMIDEVKRYSRTLPFLNGRLDYEYIYNYKWLIPWIKDYFFGTALLQINLFIISSVIFFSLLKLFFINKESKNLFKIDLYEVVIIIILFFSVLLWMITPEIRFAWGLHFVIPCFSITIFIKYNLIKLLRKINHQALFLNFLIIFLLFFSKSYSLFKLSDLFKIPVREHDFSKIEKVGIFNDNNVYFNYWRCADYEGICVNTRKKNYNIDRKYSYTFFKKD